MWATDARNYGRIQQGRKKFRNAINDEIKSHNDSWPSINSQTTDNRMNCFLKEDVPSEQDIDCCITLMKTMWKHVCRSKF